MSNQFYLNINFMIYTKHIKQIIKFAFYLNQGYYIYNTKKFNLVFHAHLKKYIFFIKILIKKINLLIVQLIKFILKNNIILIKII